MTVQLTQIQPSEPHLLPDTYTQNNTDNSFQNYLDNEQKRLGLMFSPYSQIDFSAWFGYTNFDLTDKSAQAVNLFSEIELSHTQTSPAQLQYSDNQSSQPLQLTEANYDQLANYYFSQASQPTLQELLQQTGWLTPNLEASPQLFRAQLEGKLLNKMDLQFLVDQIISQVKLVKEKGQTTLTLGLKPENLGEIVLTMTSRSGMIGIQIEASEETKKLLDSLVSELEQALKRSKINVAEITILGNKGANKHA